jgi:hypothetical protein
MDAEARLKELEKLYREMAEYTIPELKKEIRILRNELNGAWNRLEGKQPPMFRSPY